MKRNIDLTGPETNGLYQYYVDNPQLMRMFLTVLIALFPFTILALGAADGLSLQKSLSSYYWASADPVNFPRTAFIGMLCAAGTLLIVYRGFTREEDHVLNAAGLCCFGTAVFPMKWAATGLGFAIHDMFATLLFVFLAYVMWFRAKDTLKFVEDETRKRRYWRLYNVLSLCMLATPAVAWLLTHFLPGSQFILVTEILGIWSAAAYWFAKNRELGIWHP